MSIGQRGIGVVTEMKTTEAKTRVNEKPSREHIYIGEVWITVISKENHAVESSHTSNDRDAEHTGEVEDNTSSR